MLCRLMLGDPLASLPILNFALLKYSRHVAAYVVAVGGEVRLNIIKTLLVLCSHVDDSATALQQAILAVALMDALRRYRRRRHGHTHIWGSAP